MWCTSGNAHLALLMGFWEDPSEQRFAETTVKTCAGVAGRTAAVLWGVLGCSGQIALSNRDPSLLAWTTFSQSVVGLGHLGFQKCLHCFIRTHHSASGEGAGGRWKGLARRTGVGASKASVLPGKYEAPWEMTAECAHLVQLCQGPLLPPQPNLAAHAPRVPLSTWRHSALWGRAPICPLSRQCHHWAENGDYACPSMTSVLSLGLSTSTPVSNARWTEVQWV